MPTTPGVAIIGDKTRSKARSHAHRTARGFFDLSLVPDMRIICGRNATGKEAAAKHWGWADMKRKVVQDRGIYSVSRFMHLML